MSIETGEPSPTFGFLSVVDLDEGGSCGGLLLLDRIGRPIEFHCTVPVIPNRAQEILYGRTLKDFVACEQIGRALVEKLKQPPTLLLIDSEKLLDIDQHLSIPVVLPALKQTSDPENQDAAQPIPSSPRLEDFPAIQMDTADVEFRYREAAGLLKEDLEKKLALFAHLQHIHEPFERIHDAIAQAKLAA